MHTVCASEDSDVYRFGGNMAVDDSSNDNLVVMSRVSTCTSKSPAEVELHTVGRAIP